MPRRPCDRCDDVTDRESRRAYKGLEKLEGRKASGDVDLTAEQRGNNAERPAECSCSGALYGDACAMRNTPFAPAILRAREPTQCRAW